jgi:histidine triad (HIT) family protein
MSHCIFCDIISGKLSAEKVWENEHLLAFRDARPVAPTHILIVPKRHVATLNDIPDGDELPTLIVDAAKEIARQFGVAESGYRLFVNVNRGGGQVVFHLHAHFIAGSDFGSALINGAVICAALLRKVIGLFRRK